MIAMLNETKYQLQFQDNDGYWYFNGEWFTEEDRAVSRLKKIARNSLMPCRIVETITSLRVVAEANEFMKN